jgi:hypothetical protein
MKCQHFWATFTLRNFFNISTEIALSKQFVVGILRFQNRFVWIIWHFLATYLKMGIFPNFLVNLIRALWVRPGAYLLKVEQLKGASLG